MESGKMTEALKEKLSALADVIRACLKYDLAGRLTLNDLAEAVDTDNHKVAFGDAINPYVIARKETVYTVIPEHIKVLGAYAWVYMPSVSLKVPEGVISIGDRCFWMCLNLTDIVLPSTLESVGEDIFCGCSNLTTIKCRFSEGKFPGAPWGASNDSLQIIYDYTGE